MSIDPIGIAAIQAVASVVSAYHDIAEMLKGSTDKKMLGLAETRLEKLRSALVEFAKQHYALGEWKDLHDKLQSLCEQLNKITKMLGRVRPGRGSNLDDVRDTWELVRNSTLEDLMAFYARIRHISKELDFPSPLRPSAREDWADKIRARAYDVEESFSLDELHSLQDKFEGLSEASRNCLRASNNEIIRVASALSEASLRLEADLEG